MIRDMMPNFELLQPTKLADALTLLDRRGKDIWKMAGGNDSLDWFKDRVKRPKVVMDLGGIAVSPSDTAPALVVLEAKMVIKTAKAERVVDAEKFFIGPATDITHMTVVKSEELLVAIRIPNKWSGAKFYFEKVADRSTWDFALVNVASALKVTNGTIDAARVACGGVSCTPRFIKVVEDVVKGGKQDEETAELAGKTATHGARPVTYNQFKIPMMENLVKRAIRDAV